MNYKDIKTAIQSIVGDMKNLPIQATVVATSNETCDVKLSSGLVITDIRLKATVNNGTNYLLLIPKKQSKVVLLSITGAIDDLVVIKIDEVEVFKYKQDGLELIIDSTDGKISIKNESNDFLTLVKDLIGEVKKIKVSTPNGPSGTPLPDNISSLNALENKFKTLFK